MKEQEAKLIELLQGYGALVIAFSGGVDSTLLAAAAERALPQKCLAVTAVSPTLTEAEREECRALAEKIGIRHVFILSGEMEDPDFLANEARKCYYCKKNRMTGLCAYAKDAGYARVAEGSNTDDAADYRPGTQALAELPMIVSPLAEAGMSKADIRALSKAWGLPTWNKESAACLASRISYGLPITAERLKQVELAERAVREYAAGQVRVRHHGEVARIEVAPTEIAKVAAAADELGRRLKAIGFRYVTLDLNGYRMGSLNESLQNL